MQRPANDRLLLIDTLMQSLSQHILQAIICPSEKDFRAAIAAALEAHASALCETEPKHIGFLAGRVK